MNKIFYGLLVCLLTLNLPAFSNVWSSSYHEELYQIYQSGDMDQWLKVLDEMQIQYQAKPSYDLLYDIALTQYGYIGYLLGIKESKTARKYLEEAEINVDQLAKEHPQDANVLALKGALMAYQIALSPFKAPFIGPKSMNIIDESIRINPNAPQALLEKANSAHYAPSMFGGDPNLAVQFYSKAIAEFVKENGGDAPRNWIYLNAYAQMAQAYVKAKQFQNAKRTYLHILSIAPDFKWVRDELYPQFLEKHK